jgi:hypothetical protein
MTYHIGDRFDGDKVGGDKNIQIGGAGNTINTTRYEGGASVDAAVAELRAFIAELTRDGVVTPDGTVANPGAVVQAVEAGRGRLRALGAAIADGAREAVLRTVQGGVAALVVALLAA